MQKTIMMKMMITTELMINQRPQMYPEASWANSSVFAFATLPFSKPHHWQTREKIIFCTSGNQVNLEWYPWSAVIFKHSQKRQNHGVRKKPHKFHDFAGHWTKDSSDVTNNTPSVFSNFVDFGPKFGRGAIAREEWVWAKYNRSRKRRQLTPTLLPWTVVRWKYKYTNVMKNNNMDLPINVNSWLVY